MAITRYYRRPSVSPWQELEEVSNRLSRFFDDSLSTGTNGGTWMPAVNVRETGDELLLTAELPGMTHDDISIELENNVLTLSGEKTEEKKEGDEERRYHLWERRYGTFQRSFTLPRTVNPDEIRATFHNGILEVHLPKAPEAKGRRIAIEAAEK